MAESRTSELLAESRTLIERSKTHLQELNESQRETRLKIQELWAMLPPERRHPKPAT